MRKGILAGLAVILLGGCVTSGALEQAPQESKTYTSEEVAIQYEESMEGLKKTKEKESNQSNENFTGDLSKYKKDTDKRYEEAMKRVEEERRRYNTEGQ